MNFLKKAMVVFPFALLFLFYAFFEANAKEGRPTWIPLKSLVNYKGPKRENVFVEGKFHHSLGESFLLCGVPMPFRIHYQSPLFNQVNRYLVPKKSNIRIEGDLAYTKFKGWFFKVRNIIPLEEDTKFFERRLNLDYKDPTRYYDLAFLADAIARECRNSSVLAYGEKAMVKAVHLELLLLSPQEFKRRFEIAQILERKYHQPKLAFQVYRQCWQLKQTNELRMKLVELGGKFYKGKWLLEEEIKKMSGLEITKKGEWVVKDKVIFQKFIQSFTQMPKGNLRLFHKKIPSSLSKKTLIQQWKCWPQRVWRKKKGKLLYEMWIIEYFYEPKTKIEKYYLFFINGKLAKVQREE